MRRGSASKATPLSPSFAFQHRREDQSLGGRIPTTIHVAVSDCPSVQPMPTTRKMKGLRIDHDSKIRNFKVAKLLYSPSFLDLPSFHGNGSGGSRISGLDMVLISVVGHVFFFVQGSLATTGSFDGVRVCAGWLCGCAKACEPERTARAGLCVW